MAVSMAVCVPIACGGDDGVGLRVVTQSCRISDHPFTSTVRILKGSES